MYLDLMHLECMTRTSPDADFAFTFICFYKRTVKHEVLKSNVTLMRDGMKIKMKQVLLSLKSNPAVKCLVLSLSLLILCLFHYISLHFSPIIKDKSLSLNDENLQND